MRTVDTTKKPARQDWHRADIKAALERKGWSLRRLSSHHGFAPGSLNAVLHKPWPRAEQLLAETLGVPPYRIWPSRYHRDGAPKSGRGARGLGRRKAKRSTEATARNVHFEGSR